MRVMSYNVNGFKGNKDSLINMRENLDKIEAFIKGFLLADEDNLVILQEVPLKDNAICYKKIIEKFKDYKFICSYKVNVANFVTVAIANEKSNWIKQDDFLNQKIEYKCAKNTDKTDYNNRFVELYNKDYSLKILGLHIPLKKKDNVKSVDQFWDILKNYKNKYTGQNKTPLMIIGDLNAEDSKESKYQEKFQNMLEKGKDFIDNGTYKTKDGCNIIDHILAYNIKNLFDQEAKGEVINSIEYSDHYPILSPPIKKVTDRKLKKLC